MSGPFGGQYSYTTTARPVYAPASSGRVSTSPTELRDVSLAFIVLTIDLTIVLSGGGTGFLDYASASLVLEVVAVSALAALTGFVAHEMAHKFSAQRRGYWAEFRMSPMWLLLSLFTAFIGFLFAAPGATVIGGMGRKEDWGKTALAGPATNMVFSILFYGATLVAVVVHSDFAYWLVFLAFINAWFAAFNLIPFGPLDGRKVLSWNVGVWVGALAIGAALVALSGLALYDSYFPFPL